jgi:LuxR family maltose regulon positive regulatory protein
LLQILSGSVHEAGQLSDGALDLADRRGWRYALQTVAAHLARALVRLERQDLDGARQSLQDGLRAHHSDPEAAQRLVALGVQARLAAARGDLATACKSLSEAKTNRGSRVRVPAVDRWLALTESVVDLAAGRPDRVAERYPGDRPGCPEQLALARAAYAEGDHRLAQERLATVALAGRDTAGRVEAGILAALLADARGHSVAAADLLSAAVTLAAGEGIRRPFVVLAEPRLDALLHRLRLLAPQDATLVADIVGGLPAAGRPDQPVESLSEREHEILRYLATMLTAAEIAADLGLSVNTVKAHMRAVYRKLGASRRTEAVTSARLSGLL